MIGIADMQNNLCTKCDGRGFHKERGVIQARYDGRIIADYWRQGGTCEDCQGTGQRDQSGKLMAFFAALAVAVFFVIYLLGLI